MKMRWMWVENWLLLRGFCCLDDFCYSDKMVSLIGFDGKLIDAEKIIWCFFLTLTDNQEISALKGRGDWN